MSPMYINVFRRLLFVCQFVCQHLAIEVCPNAASCRYSSSHGKLCSGHALDFFCFFFAVQTQLAATQNSRSGSTPKTHRRSRPPIQTSCFILFGVVDLDPLYPLVLFWSEYVGFCHSSLPLYGWTMVFKGCLAACCTCPALAG